MRSLRLDERSFGDEDEAAVMTDERQHGHAPRGAREGQEQAEELRTSAAGEWPSPTADRSRQDGARQNDERGAGRTGRRRSDLWRRPWRDWAT